MPIHDWKRVDANLFHHFHQMWTGRICDALNDSVLPKGIPRVSIEAAASMSWYRWVGTDGVVIGIDRFGASAPFETVYTELGITVEKVVEAASRLVKSHLRS